MTCWGIANATVVNAAAATIAEKTKHQAINLMNEVVKQGMSAGKDPKGLAAAVLYTSCIKTGEQKSQIDLAKAAQTAEATIRIRVKDLKKRLIMNNQAFRNNK
jgi:transcription initiation factor TFIIB